ncbi:MAG: cysteine desulfurase [Ignavibacteriae bacterium]|nr:MAG: cysteine desulfurase [Ignavibacteriota bacterium]
MENIYLDNAATTKIDERVLDAMLPYLKDSYGNPSSVHSAGRQVKVMLEDARDLIAEFIGARSSEIYFTSGGTEANNFALKGLAFAHLNKKNHIVASPIEHSAIRETLEYLHYRFGFEITYTPINKYGEVDIDFIKDSVTDKTLLVCVMHSNNELGIINDIPAIVNIAKEKNIFVHTDSVQSIGKVNFNVNEIGSTTATISAHKIYGPKGIGALYIKKETPIDKLIHGGKQERDRRGGTENIPAIAGFKKAVEILKEKMDKDINHYASLKKRLFSILKNDFADKIIINSKESGNSLNNIVNISFNPQNTSVDADTLLIKLDMNGIAVSSGSACTSGSVQPSHVLKAIGCDDETARSSLRISFGRENKEEDIDNLVDVLSKMIN